MDRHPAVSGQFYPERERELRQMVEGMIPSGGPREKAVGLISPHAGYVYSGRIAGKTIGRVEAADRVILLGPNHHGQGHPAAVFATGSWNTPLGSVRVDEELADAILAACPAVGNDTLAHRFEHSIEVQLPFLQVTAPAAEIVPICLSHQSLDLLLALGEALGDVVSSMREEVLLLASSDMTHYEPGEVARKKDMLALEKVLDVDPEGLYDVVRRHRISMCGVIPSVVMLAAARRLGATSGELVEYGNSGDVTGDQEQVVGYAGVTIR